MLHGRRVSARGQVVSLIGLYTAFIHLSHVKHADQKGKMVEKENKNVTYHNTSKMLQ